jgi:hypothetical protein
MAVVCINAVMVCAVRAAYAEKGRSMNTERYDVVRTGSGWTVNHDGQLEGEYETKEAAFEAIKFAAAGAIKDGAGVAITIPPRNPGEAAMGGRSGRT